VAAIRKGRPLSLQTRRKAQERSVVAQKKDAKYAKGAFLTRLKDEFARNEQQGLMSNKD